MKWLLLVVLSCCGLHAQQVFEKGVLIDSVPISPTTDETFALYLPKTYDANALSPILFIFEPAARGKVGIKTFIEAAEAYNYILVCSNDARNGPYERNFGIANRLFTHIFSQFNIKDKGIYLAGFSGGSRLVSAIATLTGQIEGVIACGAGFSGAADHMPSTQGFSYVAICGDSDMNYTEAIGVKNYLTSIKFNHTLITFEGDHRWPPPEQISQAFDWLTMQAHKKGLVNRTESQLYQSYLNNYMLGSNAQKKNNLILASEHYGRVLNNFGAIYNVDSIRTQLNTLKRSKAFKKEVASRTKAFEREGSIFQVFMDRFNKDYDNTSNVKYAWWKKELLKLKETKTAPNSHMEKMVARVRYKIFALAFSRNNPNLNNPNKEQQDFCRKIANMVYPEYKRS